MIGGLYNHNRAKILPLITIIPPIFKEEAKAYFILLVMATSHVGLNEFFLAVCHMVNASKDRTVKANKGIPQQEAWPSAVRYVPPGCQRQACRG